MINTAEFLKLQPRAQQEIILDGLLHSKIQARKFEVEIHTLNSWLSTLHAVDADPEFVARFTTITRELAENIDKLTERIVQQGKIVSELNSAFHKRDLEALAKKFHNT